MDSKIDHIKEQLMSGKITRREFAQRLMVLGIAGTSAGTLLSWAEGNAFAGSPKRGGRLRAGIAHGSTTDTLDPATYENGFMQAVDYSLQNHLGEVDHTGAMQPELAESWEPQNNAKTWVFNLRRGVEFHNGKTLDSDDVIASFQHHMGETKSPAKSLLKQVTNMRPDGKHRVIFDLSGGNADFPFVASDYHVAIKQAWDGGKISPNDGIGTGPYVLKEFEPGVRFFGTRNPNYFKADRAWFDEFEMLSIVDPTARTNALTTGEVDTIDRADLKTAHLLARKPGINLKEVTGTKHYTFPMLVDIAPFDDNNVRLALKYALPREEIVEKVLFGHGVVGNDHPIAPSNPFHASSLPQRKYDVDKARFYAKKAGGVKVKLSAADAAFPGAVDAAVLYKEYAAAAGIEIEVVREPNDGYWKNVWMKKPWGACYWGGRPTEDWMFTTTHYSGADWNDTHFKSEKFDKMLIEARAETNQNKRRQLYYEMQKMVSDEGGTVVPMFANFVFAAHKNVQHGTMAGNWMMDGNKFHERWWFA
jgi:peptide/nickel transport system substrate-binding protein